MILLSTKTTSEKSKDVFSKISTCQKKKKNILFSKNRDRAFSMGSKPFKMRYCIGINLC